MAAYLSVGFVLLYAALLSAAQYYVWTQSEFTRLLLPPTASFRYFAQYSFTHFWLGPLSSLAVSLLFFGFLRFLSQRNQNFFIPGETSLGFIAALLSGWPGFVIFLPLLLASTVIVSAGRRVVWRQEKTTLGWPMILAAVVTLLAGNYLIDLLGIGVLKI